MIKKITDLKITLDIFIWLILMLMASFALGLALFLIQPYLEPQHVYLYFHKSNYLVYFLGSMPIFLAMAVMLFLTGSGAFSMCFVGFIATMLAVVNRYKVFFRQDPFRPFDILLSGEVFVISKNFKLSTFTILALFVLVSILGSIAIMVMVRTKKQPFLNRAFCLALTLTAAFLCNKYIFSSYEINKSLFIDGNQYNQLNIYNTKGFLYSFIYDYNTSVIKKPEGYNPADVKLLADKYMQQESQPAVKPHVIMVLSESFSEIPNDSRFSFKGYENPISFYNTIKDDALNGYIVVPGFGGGTADTEFNIFTGINTNDFRGVPYSNLLITKTFTSVTSVFNSFGYGNVAIHPGYDWFYNRRNVMGYYGFEKFVDMYAFDLSDFKGAYCSEKSTIQKVIEEFELHKAKNTDAPFLDVCLTIQNHGPYTDKYMSEKNFETDLPLSEADKSDLYNYFEGLKDSDMGLETLVNYFDALNEPAVILYFGDHLPYLSNEAYNIIMDESYEPGSYMASVRLNRTPYIIWQNKAAKQAAPFKQGNLQGKDISSFYLGAYLLELLGYDNAFPFFNFINELKHSYPVIIGEQYYDNSYKQYLLSNVYNEQIAAYKSWEYYRLFDE